MNETVMETEPVLAWHFLRESRRLRYDSDVVVFAGQTLTVEPPLVLCKRGLHGSIRALDALRYAPGPIVCRVEMFGGLIHGTDKFVAQHRKVLWLADASEVLHTYACDVAEQALNDAGVTDERSRNAIAVKRRWIKGEATDEELREAWTVAWEATGEAAWSAAQAAAREAAARAAGAAAGAADAAARVASGAANAAGVAARTAARTRLNVDLKARLMTLAA